MVRDPIQEKLLDIIAAKKKGRRRPAREKKEETASSSNVVSIMDALKRSIKAEGRAKN